MESQNTQLRTTERITFTDSEVALIKSQIAKNATPDEFALFLYQCKRTGLDPLARQMYCIHRGGKMTIQTSIDGFRVIAERSGDYAGQSAPEFLENENGGIIACKITVYRFRGDQRYPAAVGVAYWSEYNAGGNMWQKMPRTMISKCAEALALRKAYPQDLSGLYTQDEMQQAETAPEAQEAPITPHTVLPTRTPEQNDVNDSLQALPNLKTREALEAFITEQPEHVRKDQQFQDACKMKAKELKKNAPQAVAA